MGIRIKIEVMTGHGFKASWTFSHQDENPNEEQLAEALGLALPALRYCLVPSDADDTAQAFVEGAGIDDRVAIKGATT